MGDRGKGALRLRPCADDRDWDDLVAKHPGGTAFHLSGFLRTVGPLLGLRPHLTVAEVDGEAVGIVPMLCRSVGPVVLVNHGLPFPYLGPLLAPGIPLTAVAAAARLYLRRPVAHFRVQAVEPFGPLAGRGWEQRDTWTAAVVPVAGKDDDALLGMLARQQRSKLRQAVEQGLVSGPATRQEVDRLTGWVRETFERQGLPPRWPTGAHLRLYDALATSGACGATAVRRGDELLAVSLDVVLGDLMVGWEMGMSEEGRAAGASQVLHTANMRRARDLGVAEFDMLGAPTPGIARYKRSLGADLRQRGYAQWEPAWLPSHRHLRRLSGVLPTRRRNSPKVG